MNTEFSSIFYEARDAYDQLARTDKLGNSQDYKKADKAGEFVKNNLYNKDKLNTYKAEKNFSNGTPRAKDAEQAARVSSAIDAKMRHDRRHPQKECGLMDYDLI